MDRGSEVRDAQLMLSDAAFADTNVQLNDGPNGAPGTGRKYHPGHYVDLLRYQVFSNVDKYLIPSLKPGVAGVQMRYLWRDFEIKPDQYDFSRIELDLKLLASRKMQLIVVVSDKTFKDKQPLPNYLASYTLPNRNDNYTTTR